MADATYTGGNTTGFASPAGDYLEGRIDLSEALDLRRPSRYPVRIAGDALTSSGILPGDIMVVDAALPPAPGRLAVVMMDGRTMIGQLALRRGVWWLQSNKEDCQPLHIKGDDTEIWAIAVALVRTDL
ncbi:MAG: S24 family peptidase [Rhodospirillales bacterium]|nr:S24 family peptidase [Rhodospirillales bacterium]